MPNAKIKAAILSVFSNLVLTGLKIFAGILSGSVSILAEAIHSAMDLAAAIIAFFSVRQSDKPADKQHPYGHGKIESVSSIIEGSLIFIAAVLIIFEAVNKLTVPHQLNEIWFAFVVMVFAAIVNTFVSFVLYKTAKREDSLALEADALHLKTDVLTSLGVALGILLIHFTHWNSFDSIIAIAVALLIVKEAWILIGKSFEPLLDHQLGDEDLAKIEQVLSHYQNQFINYHKLRTRKSGRYRFIDFHLSVDGSQTVQVIHDLADRIEDEIEKTLPHTNVTIHFEPEKHSDR